MIHDTAHKHISPTLTYFHKKFYKSNLLILKNFG